MTDYEKLGVFYLGKAFDMNSGKLGEELVLYDSKDLTTHAVIIGMTGSGKTGLALGLLEEALIDNIPVIAIDPKGDLPNLLLTFPNLATEDFLPWVDEQEAVAAGLTRPQFAAKQAEAWLKKEGPALGLWPGKRFAPGYKGWDVSGQKLIFSVLPAAEIGVRLTESFMMIPRKSYSFRINYFKNQALTTIRRSA